jgi:hypothetical protein
MNLSEDTQYFPCAKEALFRANHLKKEAEFQLMFKMAGSLITGLKSNAFSSPNPNFLKQKPSLKETLSTASTEGSESCDMSIELGEEKSSQFGAKAPNGPARLRNNKLDTVALLKLKNSPKSEEEKFGRVRRRIRKTRSTRRKSLDKKVKIVKRKHSKIVSLEEML